MTTPAEPNSAPASSPWPFVVAVALTGAVAAWLAGETGPGGASSAIPLAWVLLASLPAVGGWLLGAFGLGWPLRRLLVPDAPAPGLVQMALGVAATLIADAALGRLGLLTGAGAWGLSGLGAVLALEQGRRALAANPALRRRDLVPRLSWSACLAAPPVAVLLVAAASAPGWLWSSEFGGYDALSYHLELPREWLAAGRITGIEHNVYAFLPGYVEAAYLHLAAFSGDAIAAAPACQLLHAALALLTALATGAAGVAWCGARDRGPLVALVLGTPWVIVVGSLAYNELAVCFMLAAGLLLLGVERRATARLGVAIGLLAAAACGAKLTAVGFAALPMAVLLAWRGGRAAPVALGAAAGAGALAVAPWLAGNAFQTGNPVFPFLTGFMGLGHWTPEQAATWSSGHVSEAGLVARAHEFWQQIMVYGFGASPAGSGTPWRAQWSILPWLAAAGLAIAVVRGGRPRRAGLAIGVVLLVQIGFWLGFTHLQSRFLLPAVVPMALAAAVWFAGVPAARRGAARAAAAIALAVWVVIPAAIYRGEARGAPAAMIGATGLRTGAIVPDEQVATAASRWPEIYVNRVLPPDARVHLLGEATPLYYRDDVTYQTTWDRGPVSHAMRADPDDPAAWFDALRRTGHTDLLVNPLMLTIWEDAGWNDPLITADRVIQAAEMHADLVAVIPDDDPFGVRVYRLRGELR